MNIVQAELRVRLNVTCNCCNRLDGVHLGLEIDLLVSPFIVVLEGVGLIEALRVIHYFITTFNKCGSWWNCKIPLPKCELFSQQPKVELMGLGKFNESEFWKAPTLKRPIVPDRKPLYLTNVSFGGLISNIP